MPFVTRRVGQLAYDVVFSLEEEIDLAVDAVEAAIELIRSGEGTGRGRGYLRRQGLFKSASREAIAIRLHHATLVACC